MRADLAEFFRSALLILGALFPIVNPLGNAPVFLALTREFSGTTRTQLALRIAFNSFVLLIVSTLIGTHILAFFGISLPVVQVAGGMVVLATGWGSLTRRDDDDGGYHETRHPPTAADLSQRAFYPLTLPLTVGPGSISVAIALGANRPRGTQTELPVLAATLVGSVLLALAVYICYRFAESVARLLGETAMNIITRLSSFILLCIGVQIAWNGVSALLRQL
jgi:multiple antibiotic resistance protein